MGPPGGTGFQGRRTHRGTLGRGRRAQTTAGDREGKGEEELRTNCEHLAEQDAIITAHDKELTALRKQIRGLQARASRERVSATREDRTSRPSVRFSSTEPESRENRPESADRSPRDTREEYSVPTRDPMRSDVDPTAIPLLRDPTV